MFKETPLKYCIITLKMIETGLHGYNYKKMTKIWLQYNYNKIHINKLLEIKYMILQHKSVK